MMHKDREEDGIVTHLSTTEARSGSPARMTRNILAVSLLLIMIVLALALASGFFETDRTGADDVNAGNLATSNIN